MKTSTVLALNCWAAALAILGSPIGAQTALAANGSIPAAPVAGQPAKTTQDNRQQVDSGGNAALNAKSTAQVQANHSCGQAGPQASQAFKPNDTNDMSEELRKLDIPEDFPKHPLNLKNTQNAQSDSRNHNFNKTWDKDQEWHGQNPQNNISNQGNSKSQWNNSQGQPRQNPQNNLLNQGNPKNLWDNNPRWPVQNSPNNPLNQGSSKDRWDGGQTWPGQDPQNNRWNRGAFNDKWGADPRWQRGYPPRGGWNPGQGPRTNQANRPNQPLNQG